MALRTITEQEVGEAFHRIFEKAGCSDFRIGWEYPPLNGERRDSHTIVLYHSNDSVCLEVPWQARRAMLDGAGGLTTSIDVTVNLLTRSLAELAALADRTLYDSEILKKIKVTYPFRFVFNLPSAAFSVSIATRVSYLGSLDFAVSVIGDDWQRVDRQLPDELSAIVSGACACTCNPVAGQLRKYANEYLIPLLKADIARREGTFPEK